MLSAADEDIRGYLERVETAATSIANRFDKSDWIELVAALLIAVATIATAWSAYQSTRWSGYQALATAAVHRARFQSTTESRLHTTQYLTDVSTWENYVKAIDDGNDGLADFWIEHARPEFRPALEEWVSSVPEGEVPPLTPFDRPETLYAAESRALELRAEAEEHASNAARANQLSDNYILLTVLFALVLFFAGVGTKFRGIRVRRVMVSAATIIFVVGVTFLVAMPKNVGI